MEYGQGKILIQDQQHPTLNCFVHGVYVEWQDDPELFWLQQTDDARMSLVWGKTHNNRVEFKSAKRIGFEDFSSSDYWKSNKY